MKQVQQIKLNKIIPYENNPRNNEVAIEKVVESIKEFGFTNPILLDKDNVIIAGHTRYNAALQLGIEVVPCIYLDTLTEDQVRAYRLVDNKTNEFAEWDFEKLMEELDEINDIDMSIFNLNSIHFDDLNLTDEDFIKDEPLKSKEKEKQIIYCPNCNEKIEV